MTTDTVPVPVDVLRTLDFLVEEHRKAYLAWRAKVDAKEDGRGLPVREAWSKVEHAADAVNRALRDLLTVYRTAYKLPLPPMATLTDPGTTVPIAAQVPTGA